MSLFTLLRVLLRFWWLTLAILLVTALGAWLAVASATSEYEVSGAHLVETSDQGVPEDAAQGIAGALAGAASSGDLRSSISGLYTVTRDGSIVSVQAVASERSSALTTVLEASAAIEEIFPTVAAEFGSQLAEARLVQLATPGIASVDESGTFLAESIYLVELAQPPANRFRDADFAAEVLLQTVRPQLAEILNSNAPEGMLTVDFDSRSPAAVITVDALAATEEGVRQLHDDTAVLLRRTLEDLQTAEGVPEPAHTTLRELVGADTVVTVPARPLRPMIAIIAMGLLTTVIAALAAAAISDVREDRAVATRSRVEANLRRLLRRPVVGGQGVDGDQDPGAARADDPDQDDHAHAADGEGAVVVDDVRDAGVVDGTRDVDVADAADDAGDVDVADAADDAGDVDVVDVADDVEEPDVTDAVDIVDGVEAVDGGEAVDVTDRADHVDDGEAWGPVMDDEAWGPVMDEDGVEAADGSARVAVRTDRADDASSEEAR